MDTEFLIVGGGLGGGVLAGLLGAAGRRVTVLERNPPRTPIVRPEVLWPVTVDLLSKLLPSDAITRSMVPVKEIHVYRGATPLVEISARTIAATGIQPWSTDPGATRARLLELKTFEVRQGVEAIAVLREQDRVCGVRARETSGGREYELRADWTVGDDGVHSRVRESCGIALATQLFPVEFLTFGFDWPASLPAAGPHLFLNPAAGGSALLGLGALPLPDRKGAGLVVALGARFQAAADLDAEWHAFHDGVAALVEITRGKTFPRDFVHIKRPWGHADRYGAEGAVLMGDAIHPVSPAGGQGANMSVHDAAALAEIFLSGHPKPVEEYERRRRTANERSVSITRRATEALEGRGLIRIARRFSRWIPKLANLPIIQQQILSRISQAFVE